MTNSFKLLRDYVERNDEQAFSQLVNDYINLVYSAALRRVNGDAHLAQDIAQSVFTDLARKAKSLSGNVVLSGWLYQHTCFTAAKMLRGEMRRKIREQQAVDMNALTEESDAAWKQIAPVLEEAMSHLGTRDRDAVVLRYFEQQPLRKVGAALGISEDAARMRVDRAVVKLRVSLLRRGATLSGVTLATLVAGHAVSAAPAGVAIHVSTMALAGAATTGSSSAGLLKFFAANKLKVAASLALLGGVSAILLLQTPKPATLNSAVARQILQGIFNRVSAPLPAQMRFVSEKEIVQKPWSRKQILEEVQRQENEIDPKVDYSKLSKKAQEQRRKENAELRQLRIESISAARGEKLTYRHQEWLSKSLWRLDSIETTPRSAIVIAADPPLPAGVDYESTRVEIADPSFTNVANIHIEHGRRAVLTRPPPGDHWERDKSWEAFTFEPEVAFILTFAAGDLKEFARQANAKPKWERDMDSFAGTKFDTNKLEELVFGKNGSWTVETDETTLQGHKMSVLRLKGKTISLAHGTEIAFFADAQHLTNIYRIELTKSPLLKTPYISSRDNFDANGFPHTWIVETPDPDELKKTLRFKEVEFPAQFDDKTVFLPQIPDDYTINGRKPPQAQDKK